MAQKSKILVTDQGTFDLSTYQWDDHQFSNLLSSENPINTDQAMVISKSLREEIHKMELQTLTIPLLEKIIEAKLVEYGLDKSSSVKLNSSIFMKNGLQLSKNARSLVK